jgi:hypothetical protein
MTMMTTNTVGASIGSIAAGVKDGDDGDSCITWGGGDRNVAVIVTPTAQVETTRA